MQKPKFLPLHTIWLVCALTLTLAAGMAPAPVNAQQTDKSSWQHATRLTAGPLTFGGDNIGTVTVRLTTVQGVPVGGEQVVLFVDDHDELHATTAPSGIAAFALGPDVALDGSILRFVFPGDDDHQASIAVQRLHVEPPAETTEEPDEAPRGALELPLLVLSLPQLAPRLWDSPPRTAIQQLFTNLQVPSDFTAHMPEADGRAEAETDAEGELSTKLVLAPDTLAAITTPPQPSEGVNESADKGANNSTAPSAAGGIVDSAADNLSAGEIAQYAVRDLAGQPWVAGLLVLASVLVAAPALHLAGRRRVIWFPAALRPSAIFAAIPMPAWYAMRVVSIGMAVGLAVTLVLRPETGLFLFWRVFIPVLPLLFFIAPALWRNICPMAALNQAPRVFHFTRGLQTPRWLQNYSYVIAASLFLLLASTRKVIFNTNGLALAVLILCALGGALLMGAVFRGKSGWCSSICPLLPIQRVYGQTAFVTVPHRHCQPCLGCTRNCFDLSPRNALLADLHDDMPHFAGQRKVFAGILLGFIFGFFLMPDAATLAIWQVYAILALASLVSLGSFFLLESIFRVSAHKLIVVYGAAALSAFYWFNAPGLVGLVAAPPPAWLVALLRASVLAMAGLWVVRTFRKETEYVAQVAAERASIHVTTADLLASAGAVGGTAGVLTATRPAAPVVTVEPEGTRIAVTGNRTLLEIIEQQGLEIEAGCRMGLCGADPICVLKGMEHLSKCGDDERTTLERLGLAPNTRMACMARVRGDVSIGLKPAKPDIYRSSIVTGFPYDRSVERVVIIGNGIAGVTAADHIRRRHPRCEIHLVGRERHHLYNRMGITRLIYGRSAMQGLYLLPEQWYEDFNITCWLNTQVTAVDSAARRVILGTGETLEYDRLILTTGSQSFVPPIGGFGMPGTFVLRTADDAMAIRTYVQEQACRQAVVAGGGLLGLEAAYGLHKLGIAVTVLERSPALLTRQLDPQGAEFLAAQLAQMGITVLLEAEAVAVSGTQEEQGGRVHPGKLALKDGRTLPCDLLLVAAGIRADLELAQRAGIKINRGIVVDAEMRTSDPHIYAAGDVIEFGGTLEGLWPAAVSQGTIAATNAVAAEGAPRPSYAPTAPVTTLKVAGIDLTSIGRFEASSRDEVTIALPESENNKYRKLVVTDGQIAGAILIGYPEEAAGVTEAVRQKLNVTNQLPSLRAGDWSGLRKLVE
ncbi:MAG: FAD-dependent oxidoreductase [Caldilineaceae bacterium]